MAKVKTKNSTISVVMYHYVREVKNSRYPNLKGLEFNNDDAVLLVLNTIKDIFFFL